MTGVQTCALPISRRRLSAVTGKSGTCARSVCPKCRSRVFPVQTQQKPGSGSQHQGRGTGVPDARSSSGPRLPALFQAARPRCFRAPPFWTGQPPFGAAVPEMCFRRTPRAKPRFFDPPRACDRKCRGTRQRCPKRVPETCFLEKHKGRGDRPGCDRNRGFRAPVSGTQGGISGHPQGRAPRGRPAIPGTRIGRPVDGAPRSGRGEGGARAPRHRPALTNPVTALQPPCPLPRGRGQGG